MFQSLIGFHSVSYCFGVAFLYFFGNLQALLFGDYESCMFCVHFPDFLFVWVVSLVC